MAPACFAFATWVSIEQFIIRLLVLVHITPRVANTSLGGERKPQKKNSNRLGTWADGWLLLERPQSACVEPPDWNRTNKCLKVIFTPGPLNRNAQLPGWPRKQLAFVRLRWGDRLELILSVNNAISWLSEDIRSFLRWFLNIAVYTRNYKAHTIGICRGPTEKQLGPRHVTSRNQGASTGCHHNPTRAPPPPPPSALPRPPLALSPVPFGKHDKRCARYRRLQTDGIAVEHKCCTTRQEVSKTPRHWTNRALWEAGQLWAPWRRCWLFIMREWLDGGPVK